MDDHGRYFQEHFAAGKVLLFGPVMATGGAFGLGVGTVQHMDAFTHLPESTSRTTVRGHPSRVEALGWAFPRSIWRAGLPRSFFSGAACQARKRTTLKTASPATAKTRTTR
jgi:hypothetical protein